MGYGALIERGEILTVEEDGYTVKSLDRDGVETPPIRRLADVDYRGDVVRLNREPVTLLDRGDAAREDRYEAGERVYFFLFRDGTGKILCRMEDGE